MDDRVTRMEVCNEVLGGGFRLEGGRLWYGDHHLSRGCWDVYMDGELAAKLGPYRDFILRGKRLLGVSDRYSRMGISGLCGELRDGMYLRVPRDFDLCPVCGGDYSRKWNHFYKCLEGILSCRGYGYDFDGSGYTLTLLSYEEMDY